MSNRKLGRTSSQRKAMLRDLTTDLIINETIVTTEARAKEVRRTVEKMITLGKKVTFQLVVQQLLTYVMKSQLKISTKKLKLSQLPFKKLFNDLAKRYEGRNGGYTRILKVEPRRGDAAPMAIIELV